MTRKMNKLPVMEQFLTLQGEGYHTGRSAVFVRLGGCDVGCVWCDVKESWDVSKHPLKSLNEILDEVNKYPTDFVVITGGEPSMHDLTHFIQELKSHHKYIAIETAGQIPYPKGLIGYVLAQRSLKSQLMRYIHMQTN